MEGLERIHDQILREASQEALEIEQSAQARKEATLKQERERSEAQYEVALTEARNNQERRRHQLKAELRMQERRALLTEKQEWIQKVLDEALRQLAQRPEAEKLEDALQLLATEELEEARRAHPDQEVVIRLSRQDQAWAAKLQERIPYPVRLEADAEHFTAGLLVTVGSVHFNYTYEEEIRRRKADWIGQVGALLFA